MRAAYLQRYFPPAPTLPVTFGAPGERPGFGPHEGLVDSGSDVTIFPRTLLVQAGIPSATHARLRGPWGEAYVTRLYFLDLEVAGSLLPGIYVAENERRNEVLLGRDVLNKLVVLLDGPAQFDEVLDEAWVRRLRAR